MFDEKHMTLMAHGAGHRWWAYRTQDALPIVCRPGYFYGSGLATGDLIFVQQVDDPAAPQSVLACCWHVAMASYNAQQGSEK